MAQRPSIAIVTPWTDHSELVEGYFAAVDRRAPDDELLIVDNASEPTLEFAHLYSEENLGFCGGSNVGLRHATADAVLFLNNDVQATRSRWLEEIREALEPGVLVGRLCFTKHAAVDGQQMPYIEGWCLAGMREDLLSLGGFDETLAEPAYYSDNLLCLEARQAGMTLRDVHVGLRHLANVTAGPWWETSVQAAAAVNRATYEERVRELLALV